MYGYTSITSLSWNSLLNSTAGYKPFSLCTNCISSTSFGTIFDPRLIATRFLFCIVDLSTAYRVTKLLSFLANYYLTAMNIWRTVLLPQRIFSSARVACYFRGIWISIYSVPKDYSAVLPQLFFGIIILSTLWKSLDIISYGTVTEIKASKSWF